MEAFQFFYEIGTEWSSTESFSFADSSDAEQFFKFSALFWSALFCCASNRLFSSFAAIKSFSSTIEVSLCIELNRFFDLFRVFLGLNFILEFLYHSQVQRFINYEDRKLTLNQFHYFSNFSLGMNLLILVDINLEGSSRERLSIFQQLMNESFYHSIPFVEGEDFWNPLQNVSKQNIIFICSKKSSKKGIYRNSDWGVGNTVLSGQDSMSKCIWRA